MAAIERVDSIQTRQAAPASTAAQTTATTQTETANETQQSEQSQQAPQTEQAPAAEETRPTDVAELSAAAQRGEFKKSPVPQQAPPGFDQTKWNDPNHNTPKYVVGRALSQVEDQWRQLPDDATRKAYVESYLKHIQPEVEKKTGCKFLKVKNEKILLDMQDGKTPPHWVDCVFAIDGMKDNESRTQWLVVDDNPGAQGGGAGAAGGANAFSGFPGFDPFNGMGGSDPFGFGGDSMADPAVQQIVQQITAQGGKVLMASKFMVIAEMNDGLGPRWFNVPRPEMQQSIYNGFGQMNNLFGMNQFSMVA